MEKISLFVSSPGDVLPERDAVTRVVNRINDEQNGLLEIRDIRWENAYYGAHDTFQSQIIEAEACDLVICIFWRRLGSELPPNFPKRMQNGKPFPSGTVYELMTALEARAQKSIPDVWVYKKSQPVADPIRDPEEMARRLRQWQALEDFWKEFFITAQGQFAAAYNWFETVEQFEATVEKNLRAWLTDKGLLLARPSWSLSESGSPFRGLEAFDLEHERIMFGRGRLTERAVESLQRNLVSNRGFLLLIGESGSGKSSLARAGVLPRLLRLTGEGGGRADVWRLSRMSIAAGEDPFDRLAGILYQGEALPELQQSDFPTPSALGDAMRRGGTVAVAPVVTALGRVAEAFRAKESLDRPAIARLALLLDQLEALFAASEPEQNRFAALIRGLVDTGLVAVVATLRSDYYVAYCRPDDLRALKASGTAIDVPMPGAEGISDIVRNPAKAAGLTYGVDQESGEALDDTLIHATSGRDALPLLQFTLEKLFEALTARLSARGLGLGNAAPEDLVLEPADYRALGGLEGAIGLVAEKAFRALDAKAQACLPQLVRALLRRAANGMISEPALKADIVKSDAMARLVDALLAARILVAETPSGETSEARNATIRFAHEAVIRGWPAVRDSVAADESFFRIREEITDAERRWREKGRQEDRLIAPGQPLAEARALVQGFRAELPQSLIDYVEASRLRERALRSGERRLHAAVAAISLLAIAGAIYAGISQAVYLRAYWHVARDFVLSKTLSAAQERGLSAGSEFQECSDCPTMVVIPPGTFKMGASGTDAAAVAAKEYADNLSEHPYAYADELPVHDVTIAGPIAVGKFDVTFAEWDTCYLLGGCKLYPDDRGWGRGARPVIRITWEDAHEYIVWLSRRTGRPYRLLTEAEWEYSARANSSSPFFWGDQVEKGHADCDGCGSAWDNKTTAEVGSFRANEFRLYDMAGNVWQWVEDCYKPDYQNAPSDGSPVLIEGCQEHVLRGGSWYNHPINIRSAMRVPFPQPPNPIADAATDMIGFRIARSLSQSSR